MVGRGLVGKALCLVVAAFLSDATAVNVLGMCEGRGRYVKSTDAFIHGKKVNYSSFSWDVSLLVWLFGFI